MLKPIFLAGASLVLMVPIASAADIEAPVPVYDWSGFYIGGHLGYGEANYSGDFGTSDPEEPDPDDLDLKGIVGGLQAGWNWQADSLVFGIEADVTFTDWSDKQKNEEEDTEYIEGDIDLLATLRARAGFAVDNLLLYVTAGGAIADAEYDATDEEEDPGSQDNVDFDDIGFVIGGGAEWGVDDRWTLRVEALYYSFNDKEDASDLIDEEDLEGNEVKFDDAWIVRAGLNFRL
jgi:outer membrane immunogenic protein